jgi:large subunit ribosomal protein L5
MNLRKQYTTTIVPQLQKELGLKNVFEVPKITKIVLNIGVSEPQDPRARKQVIANILDQFEVIAGQKPVTTLAKKSIATFKLRAGDPLGVKVTLRGVRMWGFLEKLISTALPRVKDFKGVSRDSFDGQGNYSLGIEEQIIFPEIDYDKIDNIRSLQINFVTNNKDDQATFKLLESFGMPFEKEEEMNRRKNG